LKTIELVNFIDLNNKEKEMILSWRNHPNTKKWMFAKSDIEKKDHFNFIESLKNLEDKKYFLVLKKTNYIGVIDFTKISNDSTHIGIYKNPNIHKVGDVLLSEIINYGFNSLKVSKLIAEVIEGNTKAIQLYKSNGFEIVKKIQLHSDKVYIMELSNLDNNL